MVFKLFEGCVKLDIILESFLLQNVQKIHNLNPFKMPELTRNGNRKGRLHTEIIY